MALDCPPGSAGALAALIDASDDRELFDELCPAGPPQRTCWAFDQPPGEPPAAFGQLASPRPCENARQIREVITSEMWSSSTTSIHIHEKRPVRQQPAQEQTATRSATPGPSLFLWHHRCNRLSRESLLAIQQLGRDLVERDRKRNKPDLTRLSSIFCCCQAAEGGSDGVRRMSCSGFSLLRSAGGLTRCSGSRSSKAMPPRPWRLFLLLLPRFSTLPCAIAWRESTKSLRGFAATPCQVHPTTWNA